MGSNLLQQKIAPQSRFSTNFTLIFVNVDPVYLYILIPLTLQFSDKGKCILAEN